MPKSFLQQVHGEGKLICKCNICRKEFFEEDSELISDYGRTAIFCCPKCKSSDIIDIAREINEIRYDIL